jgi:hypothetical protein
MIAAGTIPAPSRAPGALEARNLLPEYIDKVMSFIDRSAIKPFNVVPCASR